MKIIERQGKCIQCGTLTNIALDSGAYACEKCLNQIGKETNNIKQWLEDNVDNEWIDKFKEFLYVLCENNCTKFDNIFKTLTAIENLPKF